MAIYDPEGKIILTHSPMGVRAEVAVYDTTRLELWLSPLAGSSAHYRDRNFSNRDDYSSLFDAITVRGLKEADFIGCDYDPFHVVIRYQKQVMHVVPLADKPAVAVWFDEPQIVDLKSDKEAKLLGQKQDSFMVGFKDRFHDLQHLAVIGPGKGAFRHQITFDEGRSFYARAELAAGQPLFFIGTGKPDNAATVGAALKKLKPAQLLKANEKKVAELTASGAIELQNAADLEHIIAVNRRVLAAKQDAQGAIRAAINRIYYMIWVRDGSMIEAFQAYAGAVEPLRKWVRFMLANPTKVNEKGYPKGETFLMLVNQITKWEEDGVFFAIWSAFTLAQQSGEKLKAKELATLQGAMDWLERYCFDKKQGLFGRYFHCETPLPGSRDFGFDNAVGNPGDFYSPGYQGERIKRSYDIYINEICHAAYLMLAELSGTKAGKPYLDKAAALRARMADWREAAAESPVGLPPYGELLTEKGKSILAGPYGLDRCDYEWALSVPPFFSHPPAAPAIRKALVKDVVAANKQEFLAAWFSMLQSLDIVDIEEGEIMSVLLKAAEQCKRPGSKLPMPNTVVEMLNMPDGHPYHDIRPQAFSIGPMLAALTGLGVRRLPYGLAVRFSGALKSVKHYDWRGNQIDFHFSSEGDFPKLTVNGKELVGTWQLPENLLSKKLNSVKLTGEPLNLNSATLVDSTVRLLSLSGKGKSITYQVEAKGFNWLRFLAMDGTQRLSVFDSKGLPVPFQLENASSSLWLSFEGVGAYSVVLES